MKAIEDFKNFLTQKGFNVENEGESNKVYAENGLIDVYLSYNDEDFYRYEIMNLRECNNMINTAVSIAYQVIDKNEEEPIFTALEKGIEAFLKSYNLMKELGL